MISFVLGLSFNIRKENNKVIQIHKNDNKIDTETHSSLITTRLKNHENHHKDHKNLDFQNHLSIFLIHLNSHKLAASIIRNIPHNITYNI